MFLLYVVGLSKEIKKVFIIYHILKYGSMILNYQLILNKINKV